MHVPVRTDSTPFQKGYSDKMHSLPKEKEKKKEKNYTIQRSSISGALQGVSNNHSYCQLLLGRPNQFRPWTYIYNASQWFRPPTIFMSVTPNGPTTPYPYSIRLSDHVELIL